MSSHIISHDTRLLKEIRDNNNSGNNQVKVMGLSTDGTQEQIGTDNNNNVKVNVVSAVSVLPHHSTGSTSIFNTSDTTIHNKLDHLSDDIDQNTLQVASSITDLKSSIFTKGNSTISSGGSLQSVLIYGKKSNGDLEPLECNGDRLLVDVVELAQSGRITTSTALSSVQICGFNEGDSRFKTITCDTNGLLNVKNEKERVMVDILTDSNGVNMSGSLTAGSSTQSQDIREYRGINIIITNCSGSVLLEGSDDNTTFYEFIDLFSNPLSSGQNVINLGLEKIPWKYIRIKNVGGGAFTFNKILFFKTNL